MNRPRLGEILVMRGWITPHQLESALLESERQGAALGQVLVSLGLLRPQQLAMGLSQQLGVPFHDLMQCPADPTLLRDDEIRDYVRHQCLPCARYNDGVVVAMADPSRAALEFVLHRWGSDARLLITSKFDLLWALQSLAASVLTRNALELLVEVNPMMSARTVLTLDQGLLFFTLAVCWGLALCWATQGTLLVLMLGISICYSLDFVLRTLMVTMGALSAKAAVSAVEVQALRDDELPVYSILVPMFREPRVLPILVAALRRLDYPSAKLDIKLVLEAGDQETIEAARALKLPAHFEIIVVPPSQPQTKPKACNYALHFARGEFLTIYDAEDQPEADQLKKVIVLFQRSSHRLACVQARLNYYNPNENWLTRMFTLEYSMWFDLMLPGLERLGIPIPLGGTSNHFRTSTLRELGAWDPYNVTEDADLGIRLTQNGYDCRVVNSTTFEEANTRMGNWIRQRSRWIKGYMQTWLVHMRNPSGLWRGRGALGFFGFQFFIGGAFLIPLINPVMWGLLLIWLLGWMPALGHLMPPSLFALSLFNLVVGNTAMVAFYFMGGIKRRHFRLAAIGPTVIFYWVLISVAAYKALWQLISRPFYWEKTEHGLSGEVQRQLAQLAEPVAVMPAPSTQAIQSQQPPVVADISPVIRRKSYASYRIGRRQSR